ncbi:YkgJ family cysteine cluster protein [Geothermobacter hydrogeniphilus]|uniref:Zinc-or iron-chelating domain-containing protein n=1 Tax=Geothermobacter hydrogeniphilus TaxID=1969733 RepID=A0A1X0Y517_9BACT|nr:YkgJ family cysteine cluster protein [Geothermobacter hydrogeniphilus]ORJ60255.1 hypothetical protein B5V00_08360 [Geothermobacter hydrogeniphilus]
MYERPDLHQFRSKVAATALRLLQRNPSAGGQSTAARAVQHLAEETLTRHRQHREKIACRPGCGDCCQVNVAVLDAETEAVCSYLRQHLTPGEFENLRQAAHKLHLRVGGLNDQERLLARSPCLFLDQKKRCSIYPVRPLLCRSLTSTDADRCREAITMAALDRSPPVLCHLWQQELFNQAFLGLADALRDAGLEPRSRQLVEAVWQRLQ